MRDIKFRAWCVLDTGSYIHFDLRDYNTFDWEIFDEEPIMEQFTGLKDKNGVDIYEGDIVQEFVEDKEGDYINTTVIAYKNGGFLVDEDDCGTHLGLGHAYIKVIGNIHENPELLD